MVTLLGVAAVIAHQALYHVATPTDTHSDKTMALPFTLGMSREASTVYTYQMRQNRKGIILDKNMLGH
jgi:hypothetical protein